jgi:hypothetical protein
MEYYPTLSGEQIKYVIETSAVRPSVKTKNPGTQELIELSELSKTGGIINAYEAAVLAEKISNNNTKPAVVTKPVAKPVKVKVKTKAPAKKPF